jgi:endonuclease/exonuclease/phosphatase family metal-dependent hydrolase
MEARVIGFNPDRVGLLGSLSHWQTRRDALTVVRLKNRINGVLGRGLGAHSRRGLTAVVGVMTLLATACHTSGVTPPNMLTANIQGGVNSADDGLAVNQLWNELMRNQNGPPVWIMAQEVCQAEAQDLKARLAVQGYFTLFKAQKISSGCRVFNATQNQQKGLLLAHRSVEGYFPDTRIYVYPDGIQEPDDLTKGERRQVLCANPPFDGEWGCVTHLSFRDQYAADQADDLHRWITGPGLLNLRTVVAGDFNIDPSSVFIGALNLYLNDWDEGFNGNNNLTTAPVTTDTDGRLDYLWFDRRFYVGGHAIRLVDPSASDHHIYSSWVELR